MQRDEEQEALLSEASTSVRQSAFYMKRAMDAGTTAADIAVVLKHAADFLRELRTSLLSPKNYYELYMLVVEELRELSGYVDTLRPSVNMRTLYEQVQQSGNIVPRLYLLVTVGTVFMRHDASVTKDILKDLVEMVKGVQHAQRGLFLRHYLVVSVKEHVNSGVDVLDAMSFLLQNWDETIQLWIRMQHQLSIKDKKQREKERQELKILVGTSLVRLSQRDDITASLYTTSLLPKILEIVVKAKDKIAQEYLTDCLIQVFPDEFHLDSIHLFLNAMGSLHPQVDVSVPVVALLQRLAKYHHATPNHVFPPQDQLFDTLFRCVESAITQRESDMWSASLMLLYGGVMDFALACFRNPLPYISRTAASVTAFLVRVRMRSEAVVEAGERLALVPLEGLGAAALEDSSLEASVVATLQWLPVSNRKKVAYRFCMSVIKRHQTIMEPATVEKLFTLLLPLIRDEPNPTDLSLPSKSTVEREQHALAKLTHLLVHPNPSTQFQMYSHARRLLGQGGLERIRFTLVPLVFLSLQLTRRVFQAESDGNTLDVSTRAILQFVHEMATALASGPLVESTLSLNVFLQCALTADQCRLEAIAYEFFTQAFVVYEDQLSQSAQQVAALELMLGALSQCRDATQPNYDTLATKLAQYVAKLLKKKEQTAMVATCAHLFWRKSTEAQPVGHGVRVLECLQRALKLADSTGMSSGAKVGLFVDILDEYLYYFIGRTPEVTKQYVVGLIALVKEHLENMEPGPERADVETHYRNTLKYIEGVEF
ncbi:hypothetical protein H310_00549 [Aphanomyces invadans]|uniref:Vacuolar protein sorting-associated protein 35 n=1 Tax=Aphanomyces invadans TaxID=157072 RepID=A0A024UUZ9_9STRA|nr:hypothetical protein H310_00549 [Aphanomyces invadans]ETW10179.1 hypothetical protein H310_00549 [Aphanomyces invadans]|eukprot:XP_008861590.1 hypothetical protein H310_00549 [Aphanomyces invadans]